MLHGGCYIAELDITRLAAKRLLVSIPGREWSLDVDYGSASAEIGAAYLGMLAIDSMLGMVAAIEKLTDAAVDSGGVISPATPDRGSESHTSREPVERGTCEAMVKLCWRTVLASLSQLLMHTNGEALIVQLLKASLAVIVSCTNPILLAVMTRLQ